MGNCVGWFYIYCYEFDCCVYVFGGEQVLGQGVVEGFVQFGVDQFIYQQCIGLLYFQLYGLGFDSFFGGMLQCSYCFGDVDVVQVDVFNSVLVCVGLVVLFEVVVCVLGDCCKVCVIGFEVVVDEDS